MQRLYPAQVQAYKRGHVEQDNHTHYLPGGLSVSILPGKRCLRTRTAPLFYPNMNV
jgi:hypothetical protein